MEIIIIIKNILHQERKKIISLIIIIKKSLLKYNFYNLIKIIFDNIYNYNIIKKYKYLYNLN